MKKLIPIIISAILLFTIAQFKNSGPMEVERADAWGLMMGAAITGSGGAACSDNVGNETISGGSTTSPGSAKIHIFGPDVAACSGTAQIVYIHSSHATATPDIIIGLYESADGNPNGAALVGTKKFTSVASWSEEPHAFDVSDQSWPIVEGKYYHITFEVSAAWIVVYYDTAGGNVYAYPAHTWDAAYPDPWTTAYASTQDYHAYFTVSD